MYCISLWDTIVLSFILRISSAMFIAYIIEQNGIWIMINDCVGFVLQFFHISSALWSQLWGNSSGWITFTQYLFSVTIQLVKAGIGARDQQSMPFVNQSLLL